MYLILFWKYALKYVRMMNLPASWLAIFLGTSLERPVEKNGRNFNIQWQGHLTLTNQEDRQNKPLLIGLYYTKNANPLFRRNINHLHVYLLVDRYMNTQETS